jgi:alcohol-forming fatty acyl-CoA reductase
VSTAYAKSNLPDGRVEEEADEAGDAEQELSQVLAGNPPDIGAFAWPYAYAKQLTDRLLLGRYLQLPLLILRPTSVGPAIRQPCELYGPEGSCPISTFCAHLMYPTGGTSVFHAAKGRSTGANVLDEVPVDLVSKILLQHVLRGTRGVVHASCRSYVPRTMDQTIDEVQRCVPPYWKEQMSRVVFTAEEEQKQCQLAQFYVIGTRDWGFANEKSKGLDLHGPLGLDISDHDMKKRLGRIFHEVERRFHGSCHGSGAKL